jgi:hypothetical protein
MQIYSKHFYRVCERKVHIRSHAIKTVTDVTSIHHHAMWKSFLMMANLARKSIVNMTITELSHQQQQAIM